MKMNKRKKYQNTISRKQHANYALQGSAKCRATQHYDIDEYSRRRLTNDSTRHKLKAFRAYDYYESDFGINPDRLPY